MAQVAALGRRDRNQRQIDAGEPFADLDERVLVVPGIAGKEDPLAGALDDVAGVPLVPQRVDHEPAADVLDRDRGDRDAAALDRLPEFRDVLARLVDEAGIRRGAGRKDDLGAARQARHRPAIEVIDVQVAEQHQLQRRQLVRRQRGGRDPWHDEDRAAQVGVGEHVAAAEPDQHRRVPDPDDAQRRGRIVLRQAAHDRFPPWPRAGGDQARNHQRGHHAAHRSKLLPGGRVRTSTG